eukprot:gb/GEZJ01005861.1/.p1 GENE.gb/GEZJ01005861.1/~~gb/GEZJ01005861.1/.p1  ORF type:complete len:152 (+),score=3.66 gb/GEZJ01005861.1/:485-940(+)
MNGVIEYHAFRIPLQHDASYQGVFGVCFLLHTTLRTLAAFFFRISLRMTATPHVYRRLSLDGYSQPDGEQIHHEKWLYCSCTILIVLVQCLGLLERRIALLSMELHLIAIRDASRQTHLQLHTTQRYLPRTRAQSLSVWASSTKFIVFHIH